jgi:hypothetical protein
MGLRNLRLPRPRTKISTVHFLELLDLAAEQGFRDDSASLLGHWGGEYTYADHRPSDGLVSLNIVSHDVGSGAFQGRGRDAIGNFAVQGKLLDARVCFLKVYDGAVLGQQLKWAYEGHFNSEEQRISGSWGRPRDDSDRDNTNLVEAQNHVAVDKDIVALATPSLDHPASPDTTSKMSGVSLTLRGGTFFFMRKPISSFLFRPSEAAFLASRTHALWKWALDSVLSLVRSQLGALSWDVLQDRRHLRRRYIALVNAQETKRGLDPTQKQNWTDLVKTIHPNDLHFWRTLASFGRRRLEVVHK